MTHSRHKAREAALQAIYWSESSGDPIRETITTMSLRAGLSTEAEAFSVTLCERTWERRDHLDSLIEGVSENWALDRISRIDRILLHMALTEMQAFDDIPAKVSIDEAIELAKEYSVERSPSFINGILDTLAKQEGMIERVGGD